MAARALRFDFCRHRHYARAMGRKKPPVVTEEDAALFRAAIGPVRKMAEVPAAAAGRPKPEPQARQRAADEAAALRASREDPFAAPAGPADELLYRRDEVPPRILRRLKRGEYAVQDEVDLHALGVDAAATLLREFLADARRRQRLCVRVVHGKGLHSGSAGPVIRQMTERLLRQRSDVLAFASAPGAQGGTGAVLVLLAPRRDGAAGPPQ